MPGPAVRKYKAMHRPVVEGKEPDQSYKVGAGSGVSPSGEQATSSRGLTPIFHPTWSSQRTSIQGGPDATADIPDITATGGSREAVPSKPPAVKSTTDPGVPVRKTFEKGNETGKSETERSDGKEAEK